MRRPTHDLAPDQYRRTWRNLGDLWFAARRGGRRRPLIAQPCKPPKSCSRAAPRLLRATPSCVRGSTCPSAPRTVSLARDALRRRWRSSNRGGRAPSPRPSTAARPLSNVSRRPAAGRDRSRADRRKPRPRPSPARRRSHPRCRGARSPRNHPPPLCLSRLLRRRRPSRLVLGSRRSGPAHPAGPPGRRSGSFERTPRRALRLRFGTDRKPLSSG